MVFLYGIPTKLIQCSRKKYDEEKGKSGEKKKEEQKGKKENQKY
jgi:hypothetical protein